mmetsp:Transcript_1725/g.4210  ORF Transcript_1725/g.4210 Transcript_1725/m.4210 type:complete len:381 (-) Transcript_1725:117-1259(-)
MIQPHKKCCGCCCGLQLGCIIGCSLFLLLFGMNIGSTFSERHPDPVLARSFCEDLSPEYREEYNDCYGKDVCVCVDDQGEDKPCVFTDFESQVDAARAMYLAVSILAELVLLVAIVGAVKHRTESLRLAYRVVAPLPLFFIFATSIVAAAGEALSRLAAADEYWHRAAADYRCEGNPKAELPLDELSDHFDEASLRAICSDELYRIGPPERDKGQYRPGDMCDAEAALSMSIAGRFVYTLIFNVLLLSYLTFNLWSFYKAVESPPSLGRSYSPRSVSPSSSSQASVQPAIGQPVAVPIATAVAAPEPSGAASGGAASGAAAAGQPVAVATVASPGVAVGAMAVGVAVTPPRNSATGFELATGVELRPPPLPHVASAARVP